MFTKIKNQCEWGTAETTQERVNRPIKYKRPFSRGWGRLSTVGVGGTGVAQARNGGLVPGPHNQVKPWCMWAWFLLWSDPRDSSFLSLESHCPLDCELWFQLLDSDQHLSSNLSVFLSQPLSLPFCPLPFPRSLALQIRPYPDISSFDIPCDNAPWCPIHRISHSFSFSLFCCLQVFAHVCSQQPFSPPAHSALNY